MKNVRILFVAFLVMITGFSARATVLKTTDDKLIDDILAYAESFETALDARNYVAAKENLDELFPLLKKEMKLAKKEINALEKEGADDTASLLEDALKRKEEIHERLHSIVDASTAGLRVKADDVKALVSEYVELLGEQGKLLSSN